MDTPQKIIYNAWKKTEKPILYETRDVKGEEIIRKVNFAVPEENKNYDPSYKGICNLCGKEAHGGIPVKKMFSSNYMDWALHKEPGATHICRECAFCVGMNPDGRTALFRYPVVAEETLHLCSRKQFREHLLDPPKPPFVMMFPISQKKHLFSKSRVSYSRERYFCNLEEITIPINSGIRKLVNDIEAWRGVGFRKADIEAARIPGNAIKKYRMNAYDMESLIEKMESAGRNVMFRIALEVSQKMEEEKAICYLGFKRKMK